MKQAFCLLMNPFALWIPNYWRGKIHAPEFFSENIRRLEYVFAMLGYANFFRSFQRPRHWQIVDEIWLLGTIKVADAHHMHCAIYYWKKILLLPSRLIWLSVKNGCSSTFVYWPEESRRYDTATQPKCHTKEQQLWPVKPLRAKYDVVTISL